MNNSQYSMLPGTNELILKRPDQGARLFKRHGYHIPHPTRRDYYNGLRRHGMSFFDDLSGVLQGLFGVASVIAKAPKKPAEKTSAVFESGVASDYTGHDQGRKVREYHNLLKHLEDEIRREHDPRYLSNVTYVVGYPVQDVQPQLPPPDYSTTQLPPPMPQDSTLFGINKKLAIGLGILAAIIIYVKFIR